MIGLLLQACAVALTTTARPVAANEIAVPIQYEAKEGPDAPGNPMVRATIQGHDVWLLVDTGAGGIWLDKQFVHGLGVRGSPGKPDVDYRGPVDTELLAPVAVQLGSWKKTLSTARAFDMPKSLVGAGVLGIFNPIRLLESGAVIVDLPSSRLRILDDGKAELRSWLEAAYPRYEFEEFTRLIGYLPPVDDPDKDFYSVIQGGLAGRPDGPLLLDSGAGGATFRDRYVGKTEGTILRSPSTIRLGNHGVKVSGIRVGPHRDGVDVNGSLGMRAIRTLIIVLPAGTNKIILGFPRRSAEKPSPG